MSGGANTAGVAGVKHDPTPLRRTCGIRCHTLVICASHHFRVRFPRIFAHRSGHCPLQTLNSRLVVPNTTTQNTGHMSTYVIEHAIRMNPSIAYATNFNWFELCQFVSGTVRHQSPLGAVRHQRKKRFLAADTDFKFPFLAYFWLGNSQQGAVQ